MANQILKVQQANKGIVNDKPLSRKVQQPEKEPEIQLEREMPEQPEAVVQLESLAEVSRDESVYGSGWSLALIDERVWWEMNKILMLDLDGTVREPLSGEKFIQHPQEQGIIAGAESTITHYHEQGYQIVGITNQGGVAAGHKSFTECFEEQRYTLNLIPQIAQICFCPDFDGRECWVVNRLKPVPMPVTSFGYEGAEFRKPGPGMLKFTRWQYGVAPQDSFYVGDRQEDADAADAASVHFFWAETWLTRWNILRELFYNIPDFSNNL